MGKAAGRKRKKISGIERCSPLLVLEVISVGIRIYLQGWDMFTPEVQIITTTMYLIPLGAIGPSLSWG